MPVSFLNLIITASVVLFILLIYRQLDKNNRSLEKVRRYADMVRGKLSGFVEEKTAEIKDLSIELEYSLVRPYVYSHKNPKNTVTAYGVILGHEIGPNADQIHSLISYNINEWLTLNAGYQKIRSGENIVDVNGNLIRNVGGDVFVPFRNGIDSEEVAFLDGIRINSHRLLLSSRLEPIRDIASLSPVGAAPTKRASVMPRGATTVSGCE